MGDSPSHFKGDTLPVEMVSWEDCRKFCTKSWLSFPTEAQWEYACRAGTRGVFGGSGKLDEMGWCRADVGYPPAHSVGKKLPNVFGLHDMHGNVAEWCRDWFQGNFYEESIGATDPLCENPDSNDRVVRGGSWNDYPWDCRSAYRHARHSSHHRPDIGFRPAWSTP